MYPTRGLHVTDCMFTRSRPTALPPGTRVGMGHGHAVTALHSLPCTEERNLGELRRNRLSPHSTPHSVKSTTVLLDPPLALLLLDPPLLLLLLLLLELLLLPAPSSASFVAPPPSVRPPPPSEPQLMCFSTARMTWPSATSCRL